MEDVFPAFLVKGEEIVDVGLLKWKSVNEEESEWRLAEEFVFPAVGKADRVVFETAVGCFEIGLWGGNGSLTLNPCADGEGVGLVRCQRTRRAEAELDRSR